MRFLFLALVLALVPCCAHARSGPALVDIAGINEDELALPMATVRTLLMDHSKQDVVLRINSPGGSVFAGLTAIRDILDWKKTPSAGRVVCLVDGMAASMSFVLLQSPACDVRLATPRSMLLTHLGSISARGNQNELSEALDTLRVMDLAMAQMCSARMHLPLAEYQAQIASHAWIMGAFDAYVEGAIDGIADPAAYPPPYVP